MANRAVVIGLAAVLGVVTLATPFAGEAQQPTKVYRIGYVTVPSRATAGGVANTFQVGLRDLGWIEGKNVTIDYRFGEGHVERLPELVADMVRQRPDVIVAGANAAVAAVKRATWGSPPPIFFAHHPPGSWLVGGPPPPWRGGPRRP